MDRNINKMRPALQHMRENGNRGQLTKKIVNTLGISDAYWDMYDDDMNRLYSAVSNYCRVKNSPSATQDERNAAREPIYGLWKEMLSCAEKDEDVSDLRVCEDDISNLVGFCQGFVKDRNDYSLGADDNFVSEKEWAIEQAKRFRRDVETDLGIRIAKVNVMSDVDRDALRAERKILSGMKKADARKTELKDRRTALVDIRDNMKGQGVSDEGLKIISSQIEKLDTEIAACDKKREKLLADFQNLHNGKSIEDVADAYGKEPMVMGARPSWFPVLAVEVVSEEKTEEVTEAAPVEAPAEAPVEQPAATKRGNSKKNKSAK